MANNNLIFFEGAEISETRSKQHYKIVLEEEECTIYIKSILVENISENAFEDKILVSLFLAYIEYIYKGTRTKTSRVKNMDEDLIIGSTVKLLQVYPIETLINNIRDLKWHEIKLIYESDNPVQKLEEII